MAMMGRVRQRIDVPLYRLFSWLNELDEGHLHHRAKPLCWVLDAYNEGRI